MGTARKDMSETAAARSNVYGILANIFRAEPTVELVKEIQSQPFSESLFALGLSLGESFREAPPHQIAEDLALEYTRLFIGPGPHLSPHESVNIRADSPMEGGFWGPQTVSVKRFIEATGLEYDTSFTGMPDHLSAELEFMQRLAAREAEAWGEADEEFAANIIKIERRFLDEHLFQWAYRFCDKVIDHSAHPFYRAFAVATKGFLELECEELPACPEKAEA